MTLREWNLLQIKIIQHYGIKDTYKIYELGLFINEFRNREYSFKLIKEMNEKIHKEGDLFD